MQQYRGVNSHPTNGCITLEKQKKKEKRAKICYHNLIKVCMVCHVQKPRRAISCFKQLAFWLLEAALNIGRNFFSCSSAAPKR